MPPTARPRLTAQDIRVEPDRFIRDDEIGRLARSTPCEHGTPLTDSCHACAVVARTLGPLPSLEGAYFTIVAWGGAHNVPGGITRAAATALALLGVVDVFHRDGTSGWTAYPARTRRGVPGLLRAGAIPEPTAA